MPEQQPQLPTPPPLLLELTPEQFNLWRNSPLSRLFLTYLVHKAQDYQDLALAELLSDNGVNEIRQGELRGRVWCLQELQDLNLDDIKRLYGIETPEEKAKDTA